MDKNDEKIIRSIKELGKSEGFLPSNWLKKRIKNGLMDKCINNGRINT